LKYVDRLKSVGGLGLVCMEVINGGGDYLSEPLFKPTKDIGLFTKLDPGRNNGTLYLRGRRGR